MRQAEWALRPSTEVEIAEEKRRALVRRRFGWAFGLSSLGLCPLSCAGLGSIVERQPSLLAFLSPALLIGIATEYSRRCRRSIHYSRARLTALREEYADLHGWLGEICVLQGAAPTGFDRGILWFEDDRLMFVGERTSFALGAGGARGHLREHWGARGLLPTTTLPLRPRTRGGETALGFEILADYVPGQPYRGLDGFRKALRGWLAAGGEEAGQMPPFALAPHSPGSAALLRGAFGVTLVWALIVAICGTFVLLMGTGGLIAVGMIAVASLVTPDVWSLRLRWRAWRDRRRLDRGEG